MFGKLIRNLPALALALAVTTPAMAAPWNGGKDLPDQIASLDKQVKDAQASNAISARQATELGNEVAAVQRLHERLSKGGIDRTEQNMIEQRIGKLQKQITRAAGKPSDEAG